MQYTHGGMQTLALGRPFGVLTLAPAAALAQAATAVPSRRVLLLRRIAAPPAEPRRVIAAPARAAEPREHGPPTRISVARCRPTKTVSLNAQSDSRITDRRAGHARVVLSVSRFRASASSSARNARSLAISSRALGSRSDWVWRVESPHQRASPTAMKTRRPNLCKCVL